jgi:hypothetical protein
MSSRSLLDQRAKTRTQRRKGKRCSQIGDTAPGKVPSDHIDCLVEVNPAVGDYGHDALVSGLVDADPLRRAPRELLAGDEPVAQLPVDGHPWALQGIAP